MNVIFILIGVSLFVAIGFLVAFIWSVRSGQYEDDYTPSVRILFDDESRNMEKSSDKGKSNDPAKDKASDADTHKPKT